MIWCLDCDSEVVEGDEGILENLRTLRAIFIKSDEENGNVLNKGLTKKGNTGLKNLGNTCYINSVLQCLSNTRSIQRYFRNVVEIEDFQNTGIPDGDLVIKFTQLIKELWSGTYSLATPREFISALHKSCPFFKGMGQHDSQEFLRIFLDKLHEALKHQYMNKNWRSIISDTFKSNIQSKVTCLVCGSSYIKNEEYFDISLPIPSKEESEDFRRYDSQLLNPADRIQFNSQRQTMWRKLAKVFSDYSSEVSLYDCLLSFCLPEELTGDDKFMCTTCQRKTKSQREIKIITPPNTLVLVIKRFKFSGFGSKISTFIKFPKELDLRYFLLKPKSCVYHLTGMIQHFGGVGGGHYIGYCNNYKNNTWYEFDDSRVRQIPESYIMDQEAYILFYQKSMPELRDKINSQDMCSYIPTYWLNKYITMSEPGPIYQKYLICAHNKLKPIYSPAEYTRANSNQVMSLLAKFHSDSDGPQNVDKCDVCGSEFYHIDKRIVKELELMTSLNSIKQFEGPLYIISTEWINKWRLWMSHDTSEDNGYPGPVDNSTLIQQNQLKPKLEKQTHYRGVNRHVWWALIELYGGGPAICRTIMDIYARPAPDMKCSTANISEDTMQSINGIKSIIKL